MLKNLIGHISNSSSKKSMARTKVLRIPLNFFSFIMLILTEMFSATIFIAIYWSLCAYCEIISLLKRAKTYKRSWKFMFDVGPLCCTAYYIARRWILFYGSKYFHGSLRRKRGEAHEIKCSRRFAIFVGSVKSDKNKRTFSSLPTMPCLECLCLCLLFVVSGRFSSHRLSSKHLNCLHDT